MDVYDIVDAYYHKLGKPGSYLNFAKLKLALRRDKYEFTDLEIKAALRRIENYNKFEKRRRTLPRHVSRRYTEISGPNLVWFGDSFFVKKFKAPHHIVTVWVDAFSRRIFARPLATLRAKNVANAFNQIVEEDNEGRYPAACVTDRGSEFLSQFSANLAEKNIKHYFSNFNQPNKSYLSERAVRTLKMILAKMRDDGISDLRKALKDALSSYNNSVHSRLASLTPMEAGLSENLGKVIRFRVDSRGKLEEKYFDQFEKMNERFKVGQLVRFKVQKPMMAKESEDLFSDEIYKIIEKDDSSPISAYKLQALSDGFILKGNFLPESLIEYTESKNVPILSSRK